MKWGKGVWTKGLKPHDSRIGSPSGLSWGATSFILAIPGLGQFPFLSPAMGAVVHHPGAVGPCQDAQFCCGSAL